MNQKMNHKGSVNIFLIIIIVILLGVVGYFIFTQKTETPPGPKTPTTGVPPGPKTPTTGVPPGPKTPTIDEPEKPTLDNLKKYTNSLLGIEFYYPENFIPYLRDNEYIGDQPARFISGKDPYAPLYGKSTFVITVTGLKEANLTIDQVAENSAQHKLMPFGKNPLINKLEIEGQEARLITPSDPDNKERELIVKLKNPVLLGNSYWMFLVIHASGDLSDEVIKTISESLHFL